MSENKGCVMLAENAEPEEEIGAVSYGAALSAEAILGLRDTDQVLAVEIEEWGGTVFIRTLSARERDAWEASLRDKDRRVTKLDNFRGRFAALVLGDKTGKRLFTDLHGEALGQRSARVLDRILELGMEWNGMGSDSEDVAEKNSEETEASDSNSG